MCVITPHYFFFLKKKVCTMKIMGPFMKIMLLNEVVKHLLLKPNFKIGACNGV
jgi:hypothetical protein